MYGKFSFKISNVSYDKKKLLRISNWEIVWTFTKSETTLEVKNQSIFLI